jgi:hypothetical protein
MAIIPRRQAGQGERLTSESTEVRRDVNMYGQSGRNMQMVGKTLEGVEQQFRKLKDDYDLTSSSIKFNEEMNALNLKTQERLDSGEDPFKVEETLREEANKIFKSISGNISNPNNRMRFDASASSTLQSSVAKIQNVTRQRQIAMTLEADVLAAEQTVKNYAMSNSPAEQQEMITKYEENIKNGIGTRYTAHGAQATINKFKDNIRRAKIDSALAGASSSGDFSSIVDGIDSGAFGELRDDEKLKYKARALRARQLTESAEKEMFKQAKKSSLDDTIKGFLDKNLNDDDLATRVGAGTLSPTVAENFKLASLSNDEFSSFLKSDKDFPEEASENAKFFINAIKGTNDRDKVEGIINTVLENHINYKTGKTTSGLNSGDVVFILRASAGLDSEKKESLISAINKLGRIGISAGSIIAIKALGSFIDNWDFNSDPKKEMSKQMAVAQAEANPKLARFIANTPVGTYVPGAGVFLGIDEETGRLKFDENATQQVGAKQ